jgi:hypothetical protein
MHGESLVYLKDGFGEKTQWRLSLACSEKHCKATGNDAKTQTDRLRSHTVIRGE